MTEGYLIGEVAHRFYGDCAGRSCRSMSERMAIRLGQPCECYHEAHYYHSHAQAQQTDQQLHAHVQYPFQPGSLGLPTWAMPLIQTSLIGCSQESPRDRDGE